MRAENYLHQIRPRHRSASVFVSYLVSEPVFCLVMGRQQFPYSICHPAIVGQRALIDRLSGFFLRGVSPMVTPFLHSQFLANRLPTLRYCQQSPPEISSFALEWFFCIL